MSGIQAINQSRRNRSTNYDDSLNMSLFNATGGKKIIEYINKKQRRPVRNRIYDSGVDSEDQQPEEKIYFTAGIQPKQRRIVESEPCIANMQPKAQEQLQQKAPQKINANLTKENTFRRPYSIGTQLLRKNLQKSSDSDTDTFTNLVASTPKDNQPHKFSSKISPITTLKMTDKLPIVLLKSLNLSPKNNNNASKILLPTNDIVIEETVNQSINKNSELSRQDQDVVNLKEIDVNDANNDEEICSINIQEERNKTILTPILNVSQIKPKNLSQQLDLVDKSKEKQQVNLTNIQNQIIEEEIEGDKLLSDDDMEIYHPQTVNTVQQRNEFINKTKYSTHNMSMLSNITKSSFLPDKIIIENASKIIRNNDLNRYSVELDRIQQIEEPKNKQDKIVEPIKIVASNRKISKYKQPIEISAVGSQSDNQQQDKIVKSTEPIEIVASNSKMSKNKEPIEIAASGSHSDSSLSSSMSNLIRTFDQSVISLQPSNIKRKTDNATSNLIDSLFPLKNQWKTFKSPPIKKKRFKKKFVNQEEQKELEDTVKNLKTKELGASKRKLYSMGNDISSQRISEDSQISQDYNLNTIIEAPIGFQNTHDRISLRPKKSLSLNKDLNNTQATVIDNNEEQNIKTHVSTKRKTPIKKKSRLNSEEIFNVLKECTTTSTSKITENLNSSVKISENNKIVREIEMRSTSAIYEDEECNAQLKSTLSKKNSCLIKDITNNPIKKSKKKTDISEKRGKNRETINVDLILADNNNAHGLRRSNRSPKPFRAYWKLKSYIVDRGCQIINDKISKHNKNLNNLKEKLHRNAEVIIDSIDLNSDIDSEPYQDPIKNKKKNVLKNNKNDIEIQSKKIKKSNKNPVENLININNNDLNEENLVQYYDDDIDEYIPGPKSSKKKRVKSHLENLSEHTLQKNSKDSINDKNLQNNEIMKSKRVPKQNSINNNVIHNNNDNVQNEEQNHVDDDTKNYRPGPKCSKKNKKKKDKNINKKQCIITELQHTADSGNITEDEHDAFNELVDSNLLNNIEDIDSEAADLFLGNKKINLKKIDELQYIEKKGVGISYFDDTGSIGIVKFQPHAHKKKQHLKDGKLLIFVMRGQLNLKAEGQQHEIKTGDIINFDQDTTYEVINGKSFGAFLFQKK